MDIEEDVEGERDDKKTKNTTEAILIIQEYEKAIAFITTRSIRGTALRPKSSTIFYSGYNRRCVFQKCTIVAPSSGLTRY